MECCRVNDTSPENRIVCLLPSWVDTNISRLYININPRLPGGMLAPSRSPPVFWWSERCANSSMMILPGIWTCHVAKEAETSCFNDTWNWRAAGSLPDRSIGEVSSIWDPKNFSERPCVRGIQLPSKSLVIVHASNPYTNTGRMQVWYPATSVLMAVFQVNPS